MLKSKLEKLILDVYDLPAGKESSDFLQNIMPLLDNLQSLNNKLLVPSNRIDSLVDGICVSLQNLCNDYKDNRIDKCAFCEECAKLAFSVSERIILLSVELLSKVEVTRIKNMRKHIHGLKTRRCKRTQMKRMKENQLDEMKKMKVIYDSLSVADKVKTKNAIYIMTKKYKELYQTDCSRSVKTCQRWIREWKNGS